MAEIELTDYDAVDPDLLEDRPQRRRRAPTGLCKVCGIELDDRRRSYCDEHAGTKVVAKSNRVASEKPKDSPNVKKYQQFVAKLLAILSTLIVYQMLKRHKVRGDLDQITQDMEMTDEEAEDIAGPIGRLLVSHNSTARALKPLVDNSDIIEAGAALFTWYRRVNRTLKKLAQEQAANSNYLEAH